MAAALVLGATFGACSKSEPPVANRSQSKTTGSKPPTTIGVYRPSNGTFYLRNTNTLGDPDLAVPFGPRDGVPLAGDWNGTGTAKVGIYKPDEGIFYLRNSNSAGDADIIVPFGPKKSVPIVGDWDGDGTTTIGVYRPNELMFYLHNGDKSDYIVRLGGAGDIPIVGKW